MGDDALDVWGVHGIGGALGSVLLGAFADSNVNESLGASGELFGKQIVAVLIAAVWSYFFTFIILILLGLVIRLKPSIQEISDPDKSFHGESAYTDDAENDSKYAGTAMGEIKVNVAAGKTFLQSMFGSKKAEATTADTA